MKSGKASHARLAATGKDWSPSVARRVTGRLALTTKMTTGVDVTGRPSLAVDCQQRKPAHCRSDIVNEYTELERYSLRHLQPM